MSSVDYESLFVKSVVGCQKIFVSSWILDLEDLGQDPSTMFTYPSFFFLSFFPFPSK